MQLISTTAVLATGNIDAADKSLYGFVTSGIIDDMNFMFAWTSVQAIFCTRGVVENNFFAKVR